ncbi:LamG-like jellyroll fold domain-containing protein [Streptomyces rubiginosohelvolus]|uniref:LamG-like jellyroll fold domain-containing protein n=1 Tax=Streptomyces rubiginosohelvolus TaxID=67362 RepID=UPI0036F6D1CD
MPILVEAGWGGLVQYPWTITWTDLSDRVDMIQGVTITRGASDELSETQPGSCSMTLDNQDGALTPGNLNSPYYPWVRRNAPIRVAALHYPPRTGAGPWPIEQLTDDFDTGVVDTAVWTAAGGSTEVGGRLRQPMAGTVARHTSTRSYSLAGSSLAVKLCTLPAAGGSSSASASWYVYSNTSGTRLRWSYNPLTNQLRAGIEVGGADAGAVTFTYSPISHAWLRVREDGGTVYMETSSDGWYWAVRRSAATPSWVNTDLVQVEFAATRSGGVADVIEWDYLGAVVRPRFWGLVNEWPVSWSGLQSSVSISATDLFKWLNRQPPMRSMLAEEILHTTVPGVTTTLSAYYPLTEPAGVTAAGDISGSGAGALTVTQVGAGGSLEFGTDSLPETGETSATFTPVSASAGQYLTANLGATFQDVSTANAMNVEFWVKTTTASRAILGLASSTLDCQIAFTISATGTLQIESTNSGDPLVVVDSLRPVADGQWHHVLFDGYAPKRLWIDGAAATISLAPDLPGLRTLHVGGYRGARLFSGQLAHVAVTHSDGDIAASVTPDRWTAGTTGFAGETADLRVVRLARYAGISQAYAIGSTHDPIASQGPGGSSVVARLREVESTESGKLFADRDYFGLAYQSRELRYNPDPTDEVFTIAYADLETNGVELADDDQKLVNQVQASRPGGATQSVQAASSVLAFGPYEQQLNLIKTSDNSVLDAAYWLVSRYANPQPELREVPIEAATMPTYLDILDADISSYFTVYDLPPQAPAAELRVTVEGYTETIKERSHLIQFRTSASYTDSVWVLGDPVYGVLDSTTRLAY